MKEFEQILEVTQDCHLQSICDRGGEEHLLCAGILPGLCTFSAHNHFIDCILLLTLYVGINGLWLPNRPRVSQLVNAGARIQIPVLLFLQVKLFNHSSLPLPLEIIFISLVFFEANTLTCRVSFGPLLWCDPEQTLP